MPYMIKEQPTYLLKGKRHNEVLVIPVRDWGQSTAGIHSVLGLLEKQSAGLDLATLSDTELAESIIGGLQVIRNYTAAIDLLGNNTDPEIRGVVRVVAGGVSQLIDTFKATSDYPHFRNAIDHAMLPLKITNP